MIRELSTLITFNKTMFKKRIILIIIAIAGAIAAFQLTRGTATEPAIKPPPYEPAVRDKNGLISAAGLVESLSENTSLGSAYSGIVSEVNVKVWDKVNRGQPLLTLDRTEIKQQIEVQASIVRAAEAATERAKDQYDRWSSLKDTGAVSKSDLKNYELAREEAVAKLNTARSQLTQLEIMFRRYQIISPIDGTVLQVNVRKGEFVAAGQKAPIVVGNIEQLQIRCDVDEQLATRVREGLPAKGYLKGESTRVGAGDRAIPLKFLRIEPFVIPKVSLTGASIERVDTRVLQVIYQFDRPADHNIFVGQQMDVYIDTSKPSPANEAAK